jgi:GH18 family chitinase
MSVNLKRTRYKLVRSLIHLRPEKIGCGQNMYGRGWNLIAYSALVQRVDMAQ